MIFGLHEVFWLVLGIAFATIIAKKKFDNYLKDKYDQCDNCKFNKKMIKFKDGEFFVICQKLIDEDEYRFEFDKISECPCFEQREWDKE